MIDPSYFDTPGADSPRRPSYNETLNVVSDALVEVQADNAALPPDPDIRVNEDTFIIGAVQLYMGTTYAPVGAAMASMARTIRQYAETHRYNDEKKK